jgi:hypothetical protein
VSASKYHSVIFRTEKEYGRQQGKLTVYKVKQKMFRYTVEFLKALIPLYFSDRTQ